MDTELSGTLSGLDVSTPPGVNEIGQQIGHSNLYVKNLPADIDEPALWQLFSRCGTIEAARVVRSKAQTSKGYGFVKYQHVHQAMDAIQAFNGFNWNSYQLEVKFADQDAGPPLSGSGATPSDNLYVRNLPNNWGDMELAQLFAQYGSVLECRVLHNGDMTRGAGALVRMSTLQQASAAIDALNNVSNGTGLPLLVRFADTPEEKARKLAKKACLPPSKFPSFDLLQSIAGQYQLSMDGMHPGLPAGFTAFTAAGTPDASGRQNSVSMAARLPDGSISTPHPEQPMQSPFTDHGLGVTTPSGHVGPPGNFANSDSPFPQFGHDLSNVLSNSPALAGLRSMTPPPPMNNLGLGLDMSLSQHLPSQSISAHSSGNAVDGYLNPCASPQLPSLHSTPCSLYVKNLPLDADRLFLYEKFAPHGAVHSVKILSDEQSGKCRGVGFVNYGDANGALKAIHAMHGSKLGDKLLHVSLQTHRGRPG
ncbi:hypothetical protein WJX77_005036 [Trebouxia sp. C0004]